MDQPEAGAAIKDSVTFGVSVAVVSLAVRSLVVVHQPSNGRATALVHLIEGLSNGVASSVGEELPFVLQRARQSNW